MEAPLILSIETSGKTGGLALFRETLLGEINFSAKESYSKILFKFLPHLLETAGVSLKDLNYLAVDIGPGSFTGLRIGLSLTKGLHLVHNLPIIAVSSLEVLAFRFLNSSYPVLSIIDAYTGEIFFAVYKFEGDQLIPLVEPRLSRIRELPKYINFPVVLASETPEKWMGPLNELLRDEIVVPPLRVSLRASLVAELALLKLRLGTVKVLSGEEVLPLYLKSSEAERKRCSSTS